MTSLVSVADIRPRVSYRTIQVGTILFDEAPTGDGVVQIPGSGLTLTSSDNEFYPLVRLEVWDGPAVHAESLWEYERTFDGSLLGQLAVVDLNGVSYGENAVPAGRSRIRAVCAVVSDRGRRPEPQSTGI
ncbi:hypothetical protein [Streptomyces sp. EN16]|uniref:hypothetical protein n=1 Tax=Streptomyces sp. EN16 TaxID=212773 RepID=UPI000851C45F|nr:hypothetical protein [Streptomyces sp. EN16]